MHSFSDGGPFLLTFMDWNFVCSSYIEVFNHLGCYAGVLLVSYWRFETTYRSHLQGSGRTVLVKITVLRCVKSQKIADLTSWLITYFQQSRFFSWWKTTTVRL